MMSFYLLQQSIIGYKTNINFSATITLAVVILLILISLALVNRYGSAGKPSGSRFRYSRIELRSKANQLGFSKYQYSLLRNLIRTYKIRQPLKLLEGSPELDVVLNKAISEVSKRKTKDSIIEAQKLEFYRLKQIIDKPYGEMHIENSMKLIRLGDDVILYPENGKRTNSVIIANTRNFYCVQYPHSKGKNRMAFSTGNKMKVVLLSDLSKEIIFNSHIIGENTINNTRVMMLKHTDSETNTSLRKFRRRPVTGSCAFFPLEVTRPGKKKSPPIVTVLTQQKRTGTLVDISPGGCTFSSVRPLRTGELIKVNMELPGKIKASAFGKIVRVQKKQFNRTIMHIQFTKASATTLNRINQYVYQLG